MNIVCPHCRRETTLSLEPQGTPHPRCIHCGRDLDVHHEFVSKKVQFAADRVRRDVGRLKQRSGK